VSGRVIVVTGGRDFADEAFVSRVLDNLHRRGGIRRLAHGGATGADALAAKWARANGVECVEYRADWKQNGRAAGPIRNSEMISRESPEMVVAFPGGAGTKDCMMKARVCGILVVDLAISYVPEPCV
jgi:predicted dinucleotide-utilizing enzyme